MMLKSLKLNDRQEKVENGLNVIVKLHENLEGKVTAMGTSLDTQQKTFSDNLAAMEMKSTEKIEQMSKHAAGGATGSLETLHEMEERQSRATNLILFSVPESRAETVVARNGEDANITKQICTTLGAEHVKMTCRCLGRKSGEAARPIRVELSDQENKTTVLKNARHLRGKQI